MAPQGHIPPVANVLSTIGTVLWCIQLIPQAISNYRKKSTEGLPASMMLLWATSAVPFGTYAIVQRFAIPLQIQAQLFAFFAMVNWGQIKFYTDGWSVKKTVLATSAIIVACGAAEALLVFTLRIPYDKGIEAPMLTMGIVASIMISLGLVPPYLELAKRGGRVVGIDWIFLSIDWSGAILSLLAVVFQETVDILGVVEYTCVLALETGIFLSHAIWLIRTWHLHKKAKELGVPFDDLPEAKKYQHHPKPKKRNHAPKDVEEGSVDEPADCKLVGPASS